MSQLKVINPATEEVIATLTLMGRDEVRRIIDEAYDAYLRWSQTPLRMRSKILLRLPNS